MEFATADPSELQTSPLFESLFPTRPLDLANITESMRREGFREDEPIVMCRERNVVADGHTRRNAAIAAGVKVRVCFREFADEEAAVKYAVSRQAHRRNLTMSELMAVVPILNKYKGRGGDRKSDGSKDSRESFDPGKSAEDIAKTVGTSRVTVERIRAVAAADTPVEIKEAVKSGVMPLKEGARKAAQHRRENPKPGNSARGRKPPKSQSKPTPKPVSSATIEAAFAAPRDTKTDADEEWLGSIPLRQSVGTVIDDDARLWREFSSDLSRIKARIAEMMGPKSDSYMGPLSLALSRLTSIGPPSTWVVCPKCKNIESARVACTRCRRRGFSIPGLD